jgi:hypothetical protein
MGRMVRVQPKQYTIKTTVRCRGLKSRENVVLHRRDKKEIMSHHMLNIFWEP